MNGVLDKRKGSPLHRNGESPSQLTESEVNISCSFFVTYAFARIFF